jgi:hypothetical protein
MTSQALTRPNNPQLYNQGNDVNVSGAFTESSSECCVNGKWYGNYDHSCQNELKRHHKLASWNSVSTSEDQPFEARWSSK